MTAEELRKKIAKEQLDHKNKSILDQVPECESANVFEALIMDFSPNTESFQEMDIRRERANSGQGQLAAPSIDDATDESNRESSDSKNEQRTSPAPLDYEAEEAAAVAYEADVLDKAKYLAERVTFPGGKTLAEKKAEPAIVQAAAETFAERKARGLRLKASLEESKKAKPSGFSRRDDSVVLDYPEFDDSYWDIENCPRPFELAGPMNPSQWSIMLPSHKRTYFEPLDDCRDHDVDNDPHLRIEDAIPSYRIICKEKGGRRPAEASAIGRLHISSYGKMYLILWASRHHMKPRQANEPQRANPIVLEFINAVARHRSSELPRLLNDYFDRIREGFTDDPFSPYDFKTVIMRWYDSCPNAAAFYDAHAAGPIYYNPPFLQGCRRDIADAYAAVKMGFQRQWTHSRDIAKTLKNNIVRVNVNTENILQQEQVMFIDDWGSQFAHNLRPNVQVVRLSDLHSEAIKEASEYFMGHLVRKVYWFHGASAFQLRTDGYARTITNVPQHFTRMFPHVRFYHILAPFTLQQGRAWHDQLHAFIERIRNTRLNATLIMHPTDLEVCSYYDECQLRHLDDAPWPTDEHTPEGHLSDEGLRRRKEFMEVHYNVELWRQREHDEEADRQEEEAAQELAEELEEMGEQTRLPGDDASQPNDDDLEELDEPSGSLHIDENVDMEEPSGSKPQDIDKDADLVEPSGSNQPDKAAYVQHWAATAQVTPTEPSAELREFYSRTFNTTTDRKPHRYDYLSTGSPTPKAEFSLENFMKKAAITAKAYKNKPAEYSAEKPSKSAEYSANSPNKDRHQAGKSPSRPSTTDTTSDLSDASLPFKLPTIEPAGADLAMRLFEKYRSKFDLSTPERAALYDQLVAKANELDDNFEGNITPHFLASLELLQRFVSSDTAKKRDGNNTSSLTERLQLSDFMSQPSTSNQESNQVSSDTIEQVTSTGTEYQSIAASTIEDEDGSLDESDEESQCTDDEEKQSHEDEQF
ncbi:hypothetical protein AAVH_11314 [Aphelenchoides avenae]|nr:hypothetical protein AAVH_11314 [Aphelenchus avenae]